MSRRLKAVSKLLNARNYVLVTPKETIMEGDISSDWDGFLQISALVQIRDALTKLIKEWEKKHGRNKSRRQSRSRHD